MFGRHFLVGTSRFGAPESCKSQRNVTSIGGTSNVAFLSVTANVGDTVGFILASTAAVQSPPGNAPPTSMVQLTIIKKTSQKAAN